MTPFVLCAEIFIETHTCQTVLAGWLGRSGSAYPLSQQQLITHSRSFLHLWMSITTQRTICKPGYAHLCSESRLSPCRSPAGICRSSFRPCWNTRRHCINQGWWHTRRGLSDNEKVVLSEEDSFKETTAFQTDTLCKISERYINTDSRLQFFKWKV